MFSLSYTVLKAKYSSEERDNIMDGMAVGRRIKAVREQKKITQETLASLVDISPTHMSVIERGAKVPRLDTFVAIANSLGVSADALLLDVVDHSAESVASDLVLAIDKLPHTEKVRVLKVIEVLMEK